MQAPMLTMICTHSV